MGLELGRNIWKVQAERLMYANVKEMGFLKFLYLVIPERSSLSFVEVFTDITQPFLDVYKYFTMLV